MAQSPYLNDNGQLWNPDEQYNYSPQTNQYAQQQPEQPTTQPQQQQNPFDASQVPQGVPTGWAEDFIRRNPGDYSRISSAYQSDIDAKQQYTQPAQQTQTQQSSFQPPDWYKSYFDDMRSRQQAAEAERKQKADSLYNTWLGRSQQSLNINGNDPIIRQQADAYSANEERARRNYIGDLAESAGPLANIRGEQRMAAEHMGQRTGAFEAQLVGKELTARREEIAQALNAMTGMLSAEQQAGLQRELAILDQAIKEQGVALQGKSLDQDWQRALLNNNQFMADLGLRAENQYNYWNDPLRTR